MILLPILAILGAFLLLHLRLARHPELTLFATVCGFVGALYIFALADALRLGAIVLLCVGLAALLIAVVTIVGSSDRRRIALGALCPGLCVLVAGILLFWSKYHDLPIHGGFDEFGHWALVTKYLLISDRLYAPGPLFWFSEYPPGASVFIYFICFLAPYREGYLNLAQVIFTLAPLAALFIGVSWRQPGQICLRVAVAVLAQGLFQMGFPSLQVDDLLALHFGMAVYSYLALPADLPRSRLLLYAPILFTLPIIKEMGLAFGLMFLFLILCSLLKRRQYLPVWGVLLLVFFAGHESWAIRCRVLHTMHNTDLNHVTVANVKRAFSSAASPTDRRILSEYRVALLDYPPSGLVDDLRIAPQLLHYFPVLRKLRCPQLDTIAWTILFAVLTALTVWWERERAHRWRALWAGVLLMAFLAAYLTLLLFVHLFSWGERGWHVDAAFLRYVSTFLMAQFLVLFGLLLRATEIRGRGARLTCAVFLLGLYLYETPHFYFLNEVPQCPQRAAIERHLLDLLALLSPDAHVALICQGSHGEEWRIARYELLPRVVDGPISIGKPCHPGDHDTVDLSPEEWEALLVRNGDTHVFVAMADETFWNRYGRFFAEGREPCDFLFKVDVQPDAHVLLRPIPGLFVGRIAPGASRELVRNQAQPHVVGEILLDIDHAAAPSAMPRGQGIRLCGSDPSDSVLVPREVFVNDSTSVRLTAGGHCETRIPCRDATRLLESASEAKGWGLGYQRLAFGPPDRSPVSFSLASPWPVSRIRLAMQLRNYATVKDIQFRVEVVSEETGRVAKEHGSVAYLPGSATVELVPSFGSTRHVRLSISVERTSTYIGIESAVIVVEGKRGELGWRADDGGLRVENLLDTPVVIEALSGAGR